MKKYRTDEQFHEIMDSTINGNFTQAAKEAEEYGFYAADLCRKMEEFIDEYGDYWDNLVYVAEMAAERRYKNV